MIRINPAMVIGLAVAFIVFFIVGVTTQSDGYIYLIIAAGFAVTGVLTGLYIVNRRRQESPLESTVRDI